MRQRTSILQDQRSNMFVQSLLTYVPFVPMRLTCLRACLPHITMCVCAFVPQIATCPYFSRAHMPSFFTCQRTYLPIYIFHAQTPSCLKLLHTYVRSFFTCLRAYNHSQNILSFTSVPCIAVFSRFFDLLFNSKPQNKLLLVKLHTPILSCVVLLSRQMHAQKQ